MKTQDARHVASLNACRTIMRTYTTTKLAASRPLMTPCSARMAFLLTLLNRLENKQQYLLAGEDTQTISPPGSTGTASSGGDHDLFLLVEDCLLLLAELKSSISLEKPWSCLSSRALRASFYLPLPSKRSEQISRPSNNRHTV